jgi:hypothetical protein
MTIDEAIERLTAIKQEHGGDIELVSGLSRSGYGEMVVDIAVAIAHPYDGAKGYNADTYPVVEITLDDNSAYSTTAN